MSLIFDEMSCYSKIGINSLKMKTGPFVSIKPNRIERPPPPVVVLSEAMAVV